MSAQMWQDIRLLGHHLKGLRKDGYTVVATSGGFDPIHEGHLECIQKAARLADHCVVICNGDSFLQRKKGYVFMPLERRMKVLSYVRGVSYVVGWCDDTQYVDNAIRILSPNFFYNDGDRKGAALAPCETKACEEIGCKLVVGDSPKVASSSHIVEDFLASYLTLLPFQVTLLNRCLER